MYLEILRSYCAMKMVVSNTEVHLFRCLSQLLRHRLSYTVSSSALVDYRRWIFAKIHSIKYVVLDGISTNRLRR